MKRPPLINFLSLVIVFNLLISVAGCASKQGNLNEAGVIIKTQAVKNNPALQRKRLQINGLFTPANDLGVSSCACFKVCDGNGENCTKCTCDPEGCGTCP